MILDDDVCYRAIAARDARFDGVFFVGVTTTGVYCRPVCTAKTPGRDRCRFFERAALAERAGFRPCFRCRPELAPGHAPIDQVRTVAHAAAARIEAGALHDGGDLESLAASFGLSSRQLRRAVRRELGVSPVELAQTARLLLAKRLIAETRLPMTQVAFAAGFASVRRFNALFRSRYRKTPSDLRRAADRDSSDDSLRLLLAYRPPFDWASLRDFLAARVVPGVECVSETAYLRTVAIGARRGWLRASPAPRRDQLAVEISASLAPALPTILARLRNLFDLDARPDVIAAQLSLDPRLAPSVARRPGLRVPGAFDSFELFVRAVLGQQITVRAATTLAGRIAARFGTSIETPLPCLTRLAPTPETLANAPVAELRALGLTAARAETIRALASAVARRELDLTPNGDPHAIVARLVELPGVGPWTAQYVAMRALRWPDAFPSGDLWLRKSLGLASTREVEKASERWRPWRSYAAVHLWRSYSDESVSKNAPARIAR